MIMTGCEFNESRVAHKLEGVTDTDVTVGVALSLEGDDGIRAQPQTPIHPRSEMHTWEAYHGRYTTWAGRESKNANSTNR